MMNVYYTHVKRLPCVSVTVHIITTLDCIGESRLLWGGFLKTAIKLR